MPRALSVCSLLSAGLLAPGLLGQSVTSVSFQVSAPAAATSAKVSVYDEDTFADDPLTLDASIGSISGGTFDTGDLSRTDIPGTNKKVLRKEGDAVAGGDGGSGESTAQVYCIIKFYDKDGNQVGESVTTSTKDCSVLK